jgi:hypothetical protein
MLILFFILKTSIVVKELSRPTLVVNSVTPGVNAGQFGANKNNLLAGTMGALILRHCIHLSCLPRIQFSRQIDASQLLSALDNLAEALATNPEQTLAVHTQDTLNYFLIFIANGSLESGIPVVQ